MSDLIDRIEALTPGAKRAFLAMTGEWQSPGKKTFSWAGARQAIKQAPDLCEYLAMKKGRQTYARGCYRLTAAALKARESEG